MSADLLSVYTVCATILSLWTIGIAFHTGSVRGFIEKSFHNPEDGVMGKGKREGEDGPRTQRWNRAHRNALENLVPFSILGFLLAAQVGQSVGWAWAIVAFTVFRILHTIAYVNSKQPFRTMSFLGGWVVMVAMGVKLILMNI